MPIQFRCHLCDQLMSISRRKAGAEVTCPNCLKRTTVPAALADQEDVAKTPEELKKELSRQAESREVWDHHPNPWVNPEDDETHEELQLNKKPLPEAGLDMTPMVDVMMLLLIFFMITASFVTQQSLETTPPESDGEGSGRAVSVDEIASESVVVRIDDNDNIFIDEVPVADINELVEALRGKMASEHKTEMLIETEPAATHGQVVAVTDAGMTVQMQRIRRSSRRAAE
ncbi:ExbD/TolR family protein [Planctomicrobium sp. SH661]|uniref:ExbD/TolR family protein n=1 Tax=Planctomicrobium sp. SH661 TaxID=3448124 RepID=UPI003F5BDFE7